MQNRREVDPDPEVLGPRPTPTGPPGVAVSRSQRVVLDALRRQTGASTLAGLSTATGLHVNTLREHLQALQARGTVRRRRSARGGRGRPAWLYELDPDRVSAPSSDATPDVGQLPYAGLAATLATAIQQTSPDPRTDGIRAGQGWGRALARDAGVPDGPSDPTGSAVVPDAVDARRRLVDVLDRLGFGPRPGADAASVRLTYCPLLEAARRHPEVVCGVHLGIVQGALAEWNFPTHDVDLLPFSEPGACRLLLSTNQSVTTGSPQ